MRFFRFFLYSLFAVPIFFGCSKSSPAAKTKLAAEKLSFSAVEVDKVFAEEPPAGAVPTAEMRAYWDKVWQGGNLWGGLLVARGDKILFEGYRGFAEDGHQQPIGQDTPLHIASMSKTLTAAAVLKLVQNKAIALDEDLTQIFPKFPYPGITVRSLLSHRSGLPKYEYFIAQLPKTDVRLQKDFLSNQDVLDFLIEYKPALSRPVESGFMYCNTNFALLALIVEKYTGMPFAQAMEQMIFQPLGMKHSFIFQKKNLYKAARSFYNVQDRVYPYDHLDLINGDKNVYTTPRDLLRFSVAMYDPNFLTPDLMQAMFTPYSNEKAGTKNYGLGWRLKVYDGGLVLPYHTGWWHGTNSVFGHLLPEKVTIVAIGNKFSKGPYSALGLASLFGNYPIEQSKLQSAMGLLPPAAPGMPLPEHLQNPDE